MNDLLRKTAEKLHKEYLRKKRWKKAVQLMGCMVVFCTTYALILPAITMEKEPICGYEEHMHGAECYISAPNFELICSAETLGLHEHDEDCYDEEDNLICGMADYIIHEHDDSCYWEGELLLCTLDEVEEHTHSKKKCYDIYDELACGQEETGHFHGDTCYASERGELICDQEESEGHRHSGGCYEVVVTEKTEKICGLSEDEAHSHDEGCYETIIEEEEVLICEEKERTGHSHKDNCYEWNKYLTCTREEVDGHIHDDSCYVTVEELDCDKEEIEAHEHDEDCDDCEKLEIKKHQHGEECIRYLTEEEIGEPILICKKKQHMHTDACYPKETERVFVCELLEHIHEDFCYDAEGTLTCETAEHTHDEACYKEVEIGAEPEDTDVEDMGGVNETDKPADSTGTEVPEEGGVIEGTGPETPLVIEGESGETPPATEGGSGETPPVTEDGTEGNPPAGNDSGKNDTDSSDHSSNKDKDKDDHKDETIEETLENKSDDIVTDTGDDITDTPAAEGGDTTELPEEPEQDVTENPPFPVFPEEEPVKQPEIGINGLQKHEHGEDCYDEEGNLNCMIQDVVTEPEKEITKEELEEIQIPTLNEFAQMGDLRNYLETQMGNLRFRILDIAGGELMQDEMGVYSADTETEYRLHLGILAPQGFAEGAYFYQLPAGVTSETGSGTLMIGETEIGTWVVADTGYITFFMNAEAKKYWDVSISIDIDITFAAGLEECQIGDLMFALKTEIDYKDRVLKASTETAEITVVVPEDMILPEGAYLDVTELSRESAAWTAAVETAEKVYEDGVLDGNIYEILICGADGFELTELNMAELEISITMKAKQDFNVMYQPVQIFKEAPDAAKEMDKQEEQEEMPVMEEEPSESIAEDLTLLDAAYGLFFTTAWALETESGLEAELVNDAEVLNLKGNVEMTFTSVARTVAVVQVNSPCVYTVNEQKDAFTKDPAYADYYNKNSPLGTAGSFHIVAFDTANLGTHTNGNVLAYRLMANANFGTNNYKEELTYAQHYDTINSGSAAGTTDDILVIGSSNTVTTQDNGNALAVNGTKIDRPYKIVQDENTATAPFIDLDRVEREINGLAATLAGYETTNGTLKWDFSDQNNRYIELTDPDGVGILNISGTELNRYSNNPLKLRGFRSGHDGSIVINVDCSGVDVISMPQGATVIIDGVEQGTNEVVEFSGGKVLWNFINAEGVTINTQRMTGMVVAPGATVNIMQNLNGTVVAENVYVKAESHRTDFTGKIVHTTTKFSIQKVDSENISITLPDAAFDLYQWSGTEYVKVNTDPNQYKSAENGLISFPDLEYNTAYKLVETTSPKGYLISEEPYYFILEHTDKGSYPVRKPNGFTGNDPGSLMFIQNVAGEDSEEEYVLPTTGGMGTYWFTLGGLMMMSGAAALTIKKKRKGGEDS